MKAQAGQMLVLDDLPGRLNLLTIPSCLRSDPESLDDGDEQDLQRWIQQAPSAFQELLQACHDASILSTLSTQDKARAVVCISRFWAPSPRRTALRTNEGDVEEHGGCDVWNTAQNVAMAEATLRDPRLVKSDEEGLEIALFLLNNYIRPLFSAASKTSFRVDPDTGRGTRRDPLLTDIPATSERTDESAQSLWKGADNSRPDLHLLGSPLTIEVGNAGPLQMRNNALGSWNVFAWCLDQLGKSSAASASTQASPRAGLIWETHWPLILPPLLTLLEDSEPHFRLVGTRILLDTVLAPGSAAQGVPASLLLRTNVVPLLRGALETSFTFTSTGRAHALLDATLGASRQLAILTTAPIIFSRPVSDGEGKQSGLTGGVSSSSIPDDQGRARVDQLSRIVSEGIFRVWSFPVKHSQQTSLRSRAAPSQRHDLIRVSFRWLAIIVRGSDQVSGPEEDTAAHIAKEDTLSFASARFFGVVCEFVGGWVEREWIGAWALQAPSRSDKKSATARKDLGLSRERQYIAASLLSTAEAVFAGLVALLLASASSDAPVSEVEESNPASKQTSFVDPLPPGISTWAGRILLAAAKLWTLLYDAGLTSSLTPTGDTSSVGEETGPIARAALRTTATLKRVWSVYHELTPRIAWLHRQELLDLDATVFRDLVT